jgi:lysylphosphatidylglycerol synthetase-like protein (DUF2156 family)
MLVDNLVPKKSDIVQRGAIGISVIFLIVALSFMALFFLALAFYSWMILYIVPPLAALATAGAILLICLIVVTVGYLVLKSKPDISPQTDSDKAAEMMSTMALMAGDELSKTAKSNPKTTLLLAGIAGLIAGKYLK